jgi:hypothetical protein
MLAPAEAKGPVNSALYTDFKLRNRTNSAERSLTRYRLPFLCNHI